MEYLNITLAQINSVVGAIKENANKIIEIWQKFDKTSHIIVFPELALTGYPPEDLLLKLDFCKACVKELEKIKKISKNFKSIAIIGIPYYDRNLYNSAVVIRKGEIIGIYYKKFLSNYFVFDEKRYFKASQKPLIIEINDCKIGISIGEDIRHPDSGVEVLLNINTSPYFIKKYEFTINFLKARAKDNLAYIVYVNLVGAQDELVFDGRSMVIDPEGEILFQSKAFEEDISTVSLDLNKIKRLRLIDTRLREETQKIIEIISIKDKRKLPFILPKIKETPLNEAEIYQALITGLRDYFHKNGFKKAILGLSGGIDSSLVACLAVDALGKDKVIALFMPTEFTLQESFEDARILAKNLGIKLIEVPIQKIFETYREEIAKYLGFENFTVAEENLQARIRANLLFYMSNRKGYLVLSTSNKSELAVGYTTIYGDMSGGFAPIKDVYKTLVYKLARYRNTLKPDIPERVFKKAPSAELRPGQTDQDTLPPYEVLDIILKSYIEEGLSTQEIVEKLGKEIKKLSYDELASIVEKVIFMIKKAEYKRKQAPIGTKITKRAFGKDWCMPITNKF